MQKPSVEGREEGGRHSHPVLATFVVLTCLVSIAVLAFVLVGFQRFEKVASEQAARLADMNGFVRQQASAPRESEALRQDIQSLRQQIADVAKEQGEAVLAMNRADSAARGEVRGDIQTLRTGLDERLSHLAELGAASTR